MKDRLTYNDLVARYGKDMAYGLLLTIEKMSKIKNDIATLDEDARLEQALHALNDTNISTQH
ncbi:MAG: hypothetical protein WDO70_08940 [Alphaproteobacteria bacterium]